MIVMYINGLMGPKCTINYLIHGIIDKNKPHKENIDMRLTWHIF